jgi:hypothetical protein
MMAEGHRAAARSVIDGGEHGGMLENTDYACETKKTVANPSP